MTDMLFDDLYHEPPSAAELIRRQREAVIDAVWKSPGITAAVIALREEMWLVDVLSRLSEAKEAGDVHCGPGWGDSGGWFAGPGRDRG